MNVIEGKFDKEQGKRSLADTLPVLIEAIESGQYDDMIVVLEGEETAFMSTMSIAETFYTLAIMEKHLLDPFDD